MDDDTPLRKLTVEEAIRLKHQYDQKISYGSTGLDAREVRKLEDLTRDQRAEVARAFPFIRKNWWLLPDWVMVGGLLLGCAGWYYFKSSKLEIAAVLLAFICAAQLRYRAGVLYGFGRGYEDGNVSGVRKALGITPEDAKDIHDRAIQIDLDERTIAALDAKRKDATATGAPSAPEGPR